MVSRLIEVGAGLLVKTHPSRAISHPVVNTELKSPASIFGPAASHFGTVLARQLLEEVFRSFAIRLEASPK